MSGNGELFADAWLGVDPGQSGAAALIGTGGSVLELMDWPGDPRAAARRLQEWVLEYDIRGAAIERVSSMPKQGVASSFRFGTNFGMWQGMAAYMGVPVFLPTPREWQKGLVRPSDGRDPKERSLTVARRLFPNAPLVRKKDADRADALLIAWWRRSQG